MGSSLDAAAKEAAGTWRPEVGCDAIPCRCAASARTTAARISPGTGAVPGERIVGILTPGEGITVYPIFAKALSAFDNEPDRWIDLAWDTSDESSASPPASR